MPPLKTYDTSEAVPAELRASALELKDGKWAVEEAPADLGDAGKQAIDRMKAEKKEEERLRKAAEKERDELKRTADAKAKGISDEELTRIREEEAKARKPIEDEKARLEAENRQLKLTDRVQAFAVSKGAMADRIEDAMILLGLKPAVQRVDLTDAGGFVVKDKDGKVTTESLEDFLTKTFRTERPYLFSGTNSNGSGTLGSDVSGGPASAYDPVAAGKAAAKEQIRTREQNANAFR